MKRTLQLLLFAALLALAATYGFADDPLPMCPGPVGCEPCPDC